MSRPGGPAPVMTGTAPHDVEIRVPVGEDSSATLRTVAGDLAARAEFSLDAVADLRLAVDEGCASLLALASPGTRLTCTFAVDDDRMTVTATVSTTGPTSLPTESFGWRVLRTLTEDLRVLAEAPDVGGAPHRLALRMSLGRTGAPST